MKKMKTTVKTNTRNDVFNDGFIMVKKEVKADADFTEKSSSKTYETLGRLDFRIETIREQDEVFISDTAKGHTLSKKISVPFLTSLVLSDCVCLLTDRVDTAQAYDIIYADIDNDYRKVYLYLERVGLNYA